MTESDEKKILKLKAKITELKAQQRAIETHARKQQQKERTRRLIQKGELAEKYFKCEDMSVQEFDSLLISIFDKVNIQQFLTSKEQVDE